MQEDLRNKTVVITGASSGVGRMAALTFAQRGASIILAARNESALQQVAGECRSLGGQVLVIPTDVSDAKSVNRLAMKATEWQGKLDVWINNAGVLAAGEFDNTPMEVHRQVILTNLVGYMNGAHAILPIFKRQSHGILINNISIGGFLPVPYGAGYTAAKFGLRGFSESLKGELRGWPDIHVCDLFPAFLNTPGIQHAANYTGKVLKPAPPIYDPAKVALEMVRAVLQPRSTVYIGAVSPLFKTAHALFPELTVKSTAAVMQTYFKQAKTIEPGPGNVFATVDYGMATHGSSSTPIGRKTKFIAAGLLAGFVISMAIIGRKVQP